MRFGDTKSKLDRIIEYYNGRIDEAIERVIDKYTPVEVIVPVANLAAKGALRPGNALEALALEAGRQMAGVTHVRKAYVAQVLPLYCGGGAGFRPDQLINQQGIHSSLSDLGAAQVSSMFNSHYRSMSEATGGEG